MPDITIKELMQIDEGLVKVTFDTISLYPSEKSGRVGMASVTLYTYVRGNLTSATGRELAKLRREALREIHSRLVQLNQIVARQTDVDLSP